MMLTYPAQSAVFRPTFVSHGMVPQQFPSFPVAIAPTILHTQLPHSSFPTVIPTTSHKQSVIIPTSPTTRNTTNSPSPRSPATKQTHSSFSIDSILGKRDIKSSPSEPSTVPISPITNSSPRTGGTNGGLMYFYTPATSQPPCSPFPFAASRHFDHDLQRSPLGPMVISAGNNNCLTV